MTKTQKTIAIPALALLLMSGGALMTYAQLSKAATNDTNNNGFMGMMGMRHHDDWAKGVHGIITSIDGNSIVVAGMDGVSYTVDASDAKVKTFAEGTGPADGSISDLKVGNMIGIRGTINGTSVTATEILSGIPDRGMGHMGMMDRDGHGVMGEVTAINGDTLTVKTPNGSTFTVKAGDATVSKTVEGSLTDIRVGERIGVRGTVDGSTVTAEKIMADIGDIGAGDTLDN